MVTAVTCETRREGPDLLVRLRGVLTLATATAVRTALLKGLAEQPGALVVELPELEVGDTEALSVFTAVARQTAVWPGVPLLLIAPTPETGARLRRGRYGPLAVFDTLAAARESRVGRQILPTLTDQLLPVSGAARHGRDLVTEACGLWDLPGLVGPASIVVTELVSNAVVHARTMMTLRLALRTRHLHVGVRDGSVAEPVLAEASVLSPDTGRGLLLVDAIARRWGSLPTADGKVVWAVLGTGVGGTA